ncbi:MAG: TCR/Tet family MFS transporter [Arenibacterium sp.]
MKLPVLFILITVTLDAMGIGLILPIMPDLIQEVQGGSLANAALWGGVLATAFSVMQFTFGPMMGSLSDRYGRRPVLLISLFFMALDYLVMALAGSIWLLLGARIVGGITAATHGTASAYMADISSREEKAANFGLIGAGFGVGFVLGPVIGGLLGEMGTRAPFYAAAALSALNFLFGYFVLKETVTDQTRRDFTWRRANPFGAFKSLSALPGIRPLVIVFFVYSVALYVYPAIWAYFSQARFGWGTQMIGVSLAVYGISSAAVQAGLIRVMLRKVGERRTVIYGFTFEIVACLALAIVSKGLIALILTPIAALGAVISPALQGIMSSTVGDDAQGELQGLLTSTYALAAIVSPLMMTSAFAAFTAESASYNLPGAPFVLAAVLLVGSLWLFLRVQAPSAT